MKQYNLIIFLSFLLVVFNIESHAQTATATTTTKEGKTYTTTSSASSNSPQASTIVVTGRPTDTTNWKFKEISKDFSIGKATPIYIESVNRNIEVKTWDQLNVRIVARAKYKDDSDANKSFDDVFEQSGVKVKNSKQAFEILGVVNNNAIIFDDKRSFSFDKYFNQNDSFHNPHKTTMNLIDGNDTISTISASSFSVVGDSMVFSSDSDNQKQIRVFFSPKNALRDVKEKLVEQNKHLQEEKKIGNKRQEENQKKQFETLTKQLESLSKKVGELALKDTEGNKKEIGRLNQEISKISNQLAFQSLNKLDLNSDMMSSWVNKPLVLNWQSIGSNPSSNLTNFSSQKTDLKWTIYIPKDNKISIDSKYGNITLDNDIETAKILSKYGNVETKNIQNFVVRNEYGNIYTGNVTNADVELRSGKLKMQNVSNLIIDSKNANIDLDEVGNIKVESSNDNYDVSSIQNLDAYKSYGIFRLTTLSGKMNFSGANADIKIRNIAPSTTNIDITNKFANISLPLTDLKNYNIAVNGSFNNSFDDFSIVNKNDKGFTATKGDGKNLNTNINCNNCQLDFK